MVEHARSLAYRIIVRAPSLTSGPPLKCRACLVARKGKRRPPRTARPVGTSRNLAQCVVRCAAGPVLDLAERSHAHAWRTLRLVWLSARPVCVCVASNSVCLRRATNEVIVAQDGTDEHVVAGVPVAVEKAGNEVSLCLRLHRRHVSPRRNALADALMCGLSLRYNGRDLLVAVAVEHVPTAVATWTHARTRSI